MFFTIKNVNTRFLTTVDQLFCLFVCFANVLSILPPEGRIHFLIVVFLLYSTCFLAETVKSQTKKPKCSKGYHCSRNAYMLVYKVQQEESSGPIRTNVEVPGVSILN